MKYTKQIFIVLFISLIFSSCTEETPEVSISIYATHSDYDLFEATYVGVEDIIVDGVNATFDFDVWRNIGVGDTRLIPVTVNTEKNSFTVTVKSIGVGSGFTKEASISGVANGDILDLDLGTNDFRKRY